MKGLLLNSLVLIGSSTGGPSHIRKILKSLPIEYTPTIVIAQHMAEQFIDTFVSHMDASSKLTVSKAKENLVLKPSSVYIASKSCKILKNANTFTFNVNDSQPTDYNPSVDTLFESCARFSNNTKILALILTGIGSDGAIGIKELCNTTNTTCISESEESSIVFGMPKRAKEMSDKVKMQALDDIINSILQFGENNV